MQSEDAHQVQFNTIFTIAIIIILLQERIQKFVSIKSIISIPNIKKVLCLRQMEGVFGGSPSVNTPSQVTRLIASRSSSSGQGCAAVEVQFRCFPIAQWVPAPQSRPFRVHVPQPKVLDSPRARRGDQLRSEVHVSQRGLSLRSNSTSGLDREIEVSRRTILNWSVSELGWEI